MRKTMIAKGSQDKIKRVLDEFKAGKLKDSSGKQVTDHKQALAIGLSEAGVSRKSLQQAEMKNKLLVCKSNIDNLIRKEQEQDKIIKHEIIKFFKDNPNPSDKAGIHVLADKLQVGQSKVEEIIYKLLSSVISQGTSKGQDIKVNSNEFKMGMIVENEHTPDEEIRKKIVMDHLAEDKNYYSKLRAVEKK